MATVFARKAALRKGMLRTLRQIPEDALASQCTLTSSVTELTPAAAVARILSQQTWYNSARTVGCYLSMAKGELRTGAIVSDLLSQGALVRRHGCG